MLEERTHLSDRSVVFNDASILMLYSFIFNY